jgi:hypothetical protein
MATRKTTRTAKKTKRAPAKKAKSTTPKKAKQPEPRFVNANPLELKGVAIVVEGTGKGYLSNKFPDEVMEGIAAKQSGKGGAKASKIRDLKKEFEQSIRLDEKGRCCMPASAFKNAMVRAAKAVGIAMTDAKSMFQIEEELLPIQNSKPMQHRRAVKEGRVACCACFPNMPRKPWVVRIPVTYDAAQTSREVLVDLLNRAGFFVGVGAWRPEKNGSMGMFRVKGIA